jgi:HlyD family secretion protein
MPSRETPLGVAEKPGDVLPPADAPKPKLPTLIEPERAPRRGRWVRVALALLLIAVGGLGGTYWWRLNHAPLPPGIASGNGRIESDEIDIATKFAGRVAELLADEGDTIMAGQVVARMDTRDLEASAARADAQVLQAQKLVDAAQSDLAQLAAQQKYAEQELRRAQALVQRGNISEEIADQRQSQRDSAIGAYNTGLARAAVAGHALEAARQDAALIRVNIADNTLVAPKDGRIQYRLANLGEVLGVGGKVFAMVDTGFVYMDVFLPTAEAGKAVIGTEARIVLDAMPSDPIPAKVTYVSAVAQFTPKAVETKSERDKLMFRVRVRIDAAELRKHPEATRSGLPGVAYLRLAPDVDWPDRLQPKSGG